MQLSLRFGAIFKNSFMLFWDVLMNILVFISGMFVPIGVAVNPAYLSYYAWPLAGLYLLDMLIYLIRRSSAFYEPTPVRPKEEYFFHHWLVIDFLAALALVFIAFWVRQPGILHRNIVVLISLLPLLKLLRLHRISEYLHEYLNINPSILRLIFFVFWILLSAHLISLGWILIGAIPENLSPGLQYTTALYWAVTTLSTVGYGDITPEKDNAIQVVFTMTVMLLGVGMYSYIIGNVATLLTNLDAAKANYIEKMDEVNLFLKTHNIPNPLQERVRNYYRYLWETHKTTKTYSLLDDLPHALSVDIALYLNKNILENVPFFGDADEHFIREIVRLLELIVFLPGDTIIRQDEYGDSMYFLSSGEVEVIIDGKFVVRRGVGTFFGEGSLIKNEKRSASIRALTYCDVYRLSKKSFDELRKKYPDFDQHITNVSATRDRSAIRKQ